MWVTKLLILPVKKKDFLPKYVQIWPKIGIFGQFGCPDGGSVGGCGARAVSRKTPIYFIISLKYNNDNCYNNKIVKSDNNHHSNYCLTLSEF